MVTMWRNFGVSFTATDNAVRSTGPQEQKGHESVSDLGGGSRVGTVPGPTARGAAKEAAVGCSGGR